MNDPCTGDNETSYETKTLMACREVGKLLTSTLNLRDVLELVMLKVSQLIEAQNWSLLLREDESEELFFVVTVGIDKNLVKDIRLKPGQGIAGHVAATGEPVYLSNAAADLRFNTKVDSRTGFQTHSIICIPLKIHGKVLGVIEIINIKDLEVFKSNDLPALTLLADYAAIAIENARNFTRIERLSVTDEYTGLYNARYLHPALEKLLEKSGKEQTALAVVFVDLDNFKGVVDHYGHLLGSRVLKEVGETINACLTEKDILIKYGGDEYVILLAETNKKEALRCVEKILLKMRGSQYLQSEPQPVQVTASFGIAVFPEDATTKKDLLLLADNSMYRIKNTSKNGVGAIE